MIEEKDISELRAPRTSICINCDGSIDTNQGKNPEGIEASYGFMIIDNFSRNLGYGSGKVPKEIGTTVNVGEYYAVIQALEKLDEIEPNLDLPVTVLSDSQLIIRQLVGVYDVKKPHLKVLYDRVKGLVQKRSNVTFWWIPREQNEMADKLAGSAWGKPS